MGTFFTRERFGRPQFLAGTLLLAFLAQAGWLVSLELRGTSTPGFPEAVRLSSGWHQWHGGGVAGAPYPDPQYLQAFDISEDGFDTEHSPLLPLVTAAPLLILPQRLFTPEFSPYWRWLPRLPFLTCGVLLGASLWYVARRLCGNHGGYIALTLYCFSPAMIQAAAVWHSEPEIVAVWGAFGAIFTAIAVAHTLYAPREVVLWNWRRIVLLGVSLALAIGSQFSMIAVVPSALGFLLYVAPVRMKAAAVIWVTACMIAFALLFAAYFFHLSTFGQSLHHASFWGATWRGFFVPGVYRQVLARIARACPALVLLLPFAFVTYFVWPRSRYFGNTAPLLTGLAFITLGISHPHVAGAGFLLASLPFLFIFVSGIVADMTETSYKLLVTACVWGMLGAYALWCVLALVQIPQG
jgi:hypothetical protein